MISFGGTHTHTYACMYVFSRKKIYLGKYLALLSVIFQFLHIAVSYALCGTFSVDIMHLTVFHGINVFHDPK